MAATKFTAVYVNNEGKIIEREIPGMNTYKIAEKFAKMLNDPEETKLVCVVESWKLYPKENEKNKKKAAYRDWETDRKSTRLNSSHITRSRMPSSA